MKLELSDKAKKVWKVIGIVLLILLLLGLVWFFVIRGKVDQAEVKRLIGIEAAKEKNPVVFEEVILKGVNEILDDRNLWAQAKSFSQSSGVPIEQVVVAAAINSAKNYQYI